MALSLDAEPVRLIRVDPAVWEQSDGYPPFGGLHPGETLPDISRAILGAVPAGTRWVEHFAGRSFQQAEYLLDPVAYRAERTWEQRKRTMAYRIINGDEYFAEHATSSQGAPWRCSTTDFLTEAVRRIDALDVTAVRREFSVAHMENRGVYKVHSEGDDQEIFDQVVGYLREFAEYCRDVVARDLDLIITLW
jgi:hypothetical protein